MEIKKLAENILASLKQKFKYLNSHILKSFFEKLKEYDISNCNKEHDLVNILSEDNIKYLDNIKYSSDYNTNIVQSSENNSSTNKIISNFDDNSDVPKNSFFKNNVSEAKKTEIMNDEINEEDIYLFFKYVKENNCDPKEIKSIINNIIDIVLNNKY